MNLKQTALNIFTVMVFNIRSTILSEIMLIAAVIMLPFINVNLFFWMVVYMLLFFGILKKAKRLNLILLVRYYQIPVKIVIIAYIINISKFVVVLLFSILLVIIYDFSFFKYITEFNFIIIGILLLPVLIISKILLSTTRTSNNIYTTNDSFEYINGILNNLNCSQWNEKCSYELSQKRFKKADRINIILILLFYINYFFSIILFLKRFNVCILPILLYLVYFVLLVLIAINIVITLISISKDDCVAL